MSESRKPRRRGKPNYTPRIHHTCDGAGCEGCGESGFIVGPRSAPVPIEQLGPAQLNWRYMQRTMPSGRDLKQLGTSLSRMAA